MGTGWLVNLIKEYSKWDKKKNIYIYIFRISLVVQWLRLCASSAGGTGSAAGWGRFCMLCVCESLSHV